MSDIGDLKRTHALHELGRLCIEAIERNDIALLAELFDAGADPNLESKGYLPLEIAADGVKPAAMRLLLDRGAKAGKTGSLGIPPLARAAKLSQSPCVEMLLDAGASPHDGGMGPSPLILAAEAGCVQSMRALLSAGADVDACDIFGASALMLAIRNGNLDCAKLVERSAKPVTNNASV